MLFLLPTLCAGLSFRFLLSHLLLGRSRARRANATLPSAARLGLSKPVGVAARAEKGEVRSPPAPPLLPRGWAIWLPQFKRCFLDARPTSPLRRLRLGRAPLRQRAMPFPEQGGAVSRGCRCARRREREVQTLCCLLGLCVLVICVLALGVLYLLGRRMGEKAAGDEMPSGRPPMAQRLQAIPPCSCLEPNTWPNIHVSAKNPPSSDSFMDECSKDSHPLLHWQNTREDNPGPGKIKLDNEVFLIIPKDGTYFVYSQVTFYCPNGSCEDVSYCGKKVSDRIVVAQMISRQSAAQGGGPTLVFSSTRSIVKQRWKESLYVAGTIPLKEGDKLMVNVSNPVLVHQTYDHFSFFGAYFIN